MSYIETLQIRKTRNSTIKFLISIAVSLALAMLPIYNAKANTSPLLVDNLEPGICTVGEVTLSAKIIDCNINNTTGIIGYSGLWQNISSKRIKVSELRIDYIDYEGNVFDSSVQTRGQGFGISSTWYASVAPNQIVPFSFHITSSLSETAEVRVSLKTINDSTNPAQFAKATKVKSVCDGPSFCATTFQFKNTSKKPAHYRWYIMYYDADGKTVGLFYNNSSIVVGKNKTSKVVSRRAAFPKYPQYKYVKVWVLKLF